MLTIDGLVKEYGRIRAVDGLSLTVRPGEVLGMLGPNGSGKSTTVRVVLGFLKATAGRAGLDGLDCWADSVAVRERVAYLPAELRLYESMTGRKLLRFLADLRRFDRTAAAEAMAKEFDIDLSRRLTAMSSGMKRKVALIHALTLPCELVILDEPTSALDPVMRDGFLDQIRRVQKAGRTVLFSSHVLSEVEAVCDRVVILRAGKLVHEQPMADLRGGRSVEATFAVTPNTGPDGRPFLAHPVAGTPRVGWDYVGPTDQLLGWLRAVAGDDVRINPRGLSAVYARYHAGEGP